MISFYDEKDYDIQIENLNSMKNTKILKIARN